MLSSRNAKGKLKFDFLIFDLKLHFAPKSLSSPFPKTHLEQRHTHPSRMIALKLIGNTNFILGNSLFSQKRRKTQNKTGVTQKRLKNIKFFFFEKD